jgi:hypothetical protein
MRRCAIKKSCENARNPYLIFGISCQYVSPKLLKLGSTQGKIFKIFSSFELPVLYSQQDDLAETLIASLLIFNVPVGSAESGLWHSESQNACTWVENLGLNRRNNLRSHHF